MIQLMLAMFNTLWGTESQPKWQENSTRPAADVVKHETKSASPEGTSEIQSKTTTRTRTKLDIDGDIKRLEEVLQVCPRERRRKDAYKSLINALSKMGVELIFK